MLLSSSTYCWRAVSSSFQALRTPSATWFSASRRPASAWSRCARAALICAGREFGDRKVYFRPMPNAQSGSVSISSRRRKSYWPKAKICGFSLACCTRTPCSACATMARRRAICGWRACAVRSKLATGSSGTRCTNSGETGCTSPPLRSSVASAAFSVARSFTVFWYSRSALSRATVACRRWARVAKPSRSSFSASDRWRLRPSRTSRRTSTACSARRCPK